MSGNIGVVDWFTKSIRDEVIYPDQSDRQLKVLIEDIIRVFDSSSTRLSKIANELYDTLEHNELLNSIASDSRFPICSLFHHLKNTSGIAVCLLIQKIDIDPGYGSKNLGKYGISLKYEEKDLVSLIRIAALLHDIGKPRSFTQTKKYQPYHYHTTQSREIIEHILSNTTSPLVEKFELDKILPLLASRHHSRDATTPLENLLSQADTVASAADRVNEINSFLDNNTLTVKCNDRIFPHEINFDAGDMKCQETPHTVILGNGITEIRNVVPKDANAKYARLFIDHTSHGGPVHYLGNPGKLPGSIGILSMDMMGIQGFIGEADKLKMLRGGSAIVDDALKCAKDIISREVCSEAVLFCGGGNLLSFIPNTDHYRSIMKEMIKKKVREVSKNGLHGAVITFEEMLSDVAGKFDRTLEHSQDKLDIEKNITRERPTIPNTKDVCGYCFKRPKPYSSDMCSACKVKNDRGERGKSNIFIQDTHGAQRPSELAHLGDSIAALVIDGNMMGRMFQQTTTPAEYTYKSQIFESRFNGILKRTIDDFCNEPSSLDLILHHHNGQEFLGIDVLYSGGDDVLILMNAKGALQFTEQLVNNVAEEFTFKSKFHDGTVFKNPVITISAGIAIANNRFPIYFLLNAAREMESDAKKAFRNDTKTDDFDFIKLPEGAMSVTAISSAMPGKDHVSFVIKRDAESKHDLKQLKKMISIALDKEKSRALVSDLITCPPSERERLDLIKYMYSSIQRKSSDIGLDECEWMA